MGAGFFFVAKKDKTLHPCIDYWGLNEISVKNKYPLPLSLLLLSFSRVQLSSPRWISRTLTILCGSSQGTSGRWPSIPLLGHFEYVVVPFGLRNAQAVFHALVNDVLRDYINHFVLAYLDDILIFSKNLPDHVSHVRQVLQRLLEDKLYVKVEERSLMPAR